MDRGAIKRTAVLGDGWLSAWFLPEDIEKRFRELKEMAALGRIPDAIHLGIEVYECIDENSSKARKDCLGTLAIGRSTFEKADDSRSAGGSEPHRIAGRNPPQG